MTKLNDSLVSLATGLGGYRDAPFTGLHVFISNVVLHEKAQPNPEPEEP